MVIVIFGWVLFSQADIVSTIEYIKVMLGLGNYKILNDYTIFYIKEYWIIICIAIAASMPILQQINKLGVKTRKIVDLTRPIAIIISFALVTIYLVNSTFNPFIYFNF